jgi:hypothetical protein
MNFFFTWRIILEVGKTQDCQVKFGKHLEMLLCNFVVEPFLIWITSVNEKYVWIPQIWKFECLTRNRMEKHHK